MFVSTKPKGQAVFLDRDGVINVDNGYVFRIEDFIFKNDIFDFVKRVNELQVKVIIITNQAGIARGFYTETQFHKLNDWMLAEFKANDAIIDAVYYSPYHAKEGIGKYRVDHFSRKPNPGMIFDAARDFNLDLTRSILIGDQSTDIAAGIRAGIKVNLLISEEKRSALDNFQTHQIEKLDEALQYLISL